MVSKKVSGLVAVLLWGTLVVNTGMADGVYVDKPRRTAVVGYSESGAVGETVTFRYCKMETGSNAPFARGCTPLLLPNSSPQQVVWKMPEFEALLVELKMSKGDIDSLLTDLLENAEGLPSVDLKVKAENNAATQSLMALVAKKRLELIANAEKDAAKPPPKPSTNPNAGKILTTSITVGDHFNEHTSWDTLRFQMNGEIHRRLKEKCGWHNQYRILDEKESYPKDNNPFSTGRVLRCDVTFECV